MITKLAKDYSELTDDELYNEVRKNFGLAAGGVGTSIAASLGTATLAPNAAFDTSRDYYAGEGKRGQRLLSAVKKNKKPVGLTAAGLGVWLGGAGMSTLGAKRIHDIDKEIYANRPNILAEIEGRS